MRSSILGPTAVATLLALSTTAGAQSAPAPPSDGTQAAPAPVRPAPPPVDPPPGYPPPGYPPQPPGYPPPGYPPQPPGYPPQPPVYPPPGYPPQQPVYPPPGGYYPPPYPYGYPGYPPAYPPPIAAPPPPPTAEQIDDLARRGHRKKVGGAIMMAIGPALLVTGVVLMVHGALHTDASNCTFSGYCANTYAWVTSGEEWSGLLAVLVGAPVLGGGIALYVEGGREVGKAEQLRRTIAPSISLAPGGRGGTFGLRGTF